MNNAYQQPATECIRCKGNNLKLGNITTGHHITFCPADAKFFSFNLYLYALACKDCGHVELLLNHPEELK